MYLLPLRIENNQEQADDNQKIVLTFAEVSGIRWSTSQCSTILSFVFEPKDVDTGPRPVLLDRLSGATLIEHQIVESLRGPLLGFR
jgi:hypothetical protein